MRALLPLLACAGLLAGCATGPVIAEALDGCRVVASGQVGSVALGLVNTSNEPITIDAIAPQQLEGGTVVDQWFVRTEAEPDPVIVDGDRADVEAGGADPTDLAGTVLQPEEAGYVAIAIRRDGRADALLEVVDITTDSETVSGPVRLLLTDSCEE